MVLPMGGEHAPAVLDGRHLVLVGLMGSGKSTVGALVALELGRPFVDLDDEVARREGRGVRELLAAGAGAAFRAAETAALAELLAGSDPLVVATGGGAVLDESSRQLLSGDPVVVWLQAPTATLVARVEHDGAADRPLLDDGPEAVLARLATERGPLYAEVADVCVDSASDDPSGVAASVVAALVGHGGGGDDAVGQVGQ